jgi:eukaryotic-like serine/threonine-protein kinase
VYSLGVIAYELLSSSLPFAGPAPHDFREQHLNMGPPSLGNVPAPLGSLIDECLFKAPAARPTPADVLARLAGIEEPAPSSGLAKLQEANRAEVARAGEIARYASERRSEADRRAALFDAADTGFQRIAATLERMISEASPAAAVEPGRDGGWCIRLNKAELELVPPRMTSENPWEPWQRPAFEVIAHAAIGIRIPPGRDGYEGSSHSLWFCDARGAGNFQWFETAFMVSAFIPKRGRQNPFALNPSAEAAKAVWMGVAEYEVAWPFTPLDIGDLRDFVDQWASWFAEAAQGRLQHPGTMPERSVERSWRFT